MPWSFKDYLNSLSDSQARTLWEWLDSTPTAVIDMIAYIAEGHPALAKRMVK